MISKKTSTITCHNENSRKTMLPETGILHLPNGCNVEMPSYTIKSESNLVGSTKYLYSSELTFNINAFEPIFRKLAFFGPPF